MKLNCLSIFLGFVLLFVLCVGSVHAQVNSSGFAQSIPVKEQLDDGDILCSYQEGISKCNQEYDSAIFGVYTQNPSIQMSDSEIENGKTVVRDGISKVRVKGPIAEGDFITTSATAGVGEKATTNGYVVGISLDSLEGTDIGEVQLIINIHPATTLAGARGNLIQFIRKGISVPIFQPLESFRYLLAVLMIVISFTLGLVYFGRSSRSGIEAIGRNPLAKRVIQLTVILNIVLTMVIVLVGLSIAYLILIL